MWGVLLTLYVAVAALNYSVVQSYLGAAAGRMFSSQWGGTVRIGSLHAMPWDHLMADNVLMVAPDGDTILDVKHLRVHFRRFPYSKMHLELDRVSLRDGYYHLAITHVPETDIYLTNLEHIISYYQSDDASSIASGPFTVDVHHLNVSHLRYRQDLPDEGIAHWPEGVDIAHMDFRDINVRAKDIHVVNDDVSVRLVKFSTTERSGMRVDHVEGNVHVSPHDITVHDFELRTPQSTVLADVEITWDGWGGHEYLADVQHDIQLHHGTSVALADAAYWAPVLWGIDATFDAEGHVKGTIGDMHINDLSAHWGENSMLQLTGDVRGLPDIRQTVFDVDIERLRTTQNDVRALGMDKKAQPTAHYAVVDLPDMILKQVDYVDMSMRLHGGWQEAGTLNMLLESGMGNLHADMMVAPGPRGARFTADVGSSGLGLKLLRSDWLSHTGFDMSVSGRWDNFADLNTLYAEAEGELVGSVVRGRRLAPIEVAGGMRSGVTHVRISSTDSLALFDAEAEARLLDSVKSGSLTLAAKQVCTEALGLTNERYGILSTRLTADCEGSTLDEMMAEVRMHDTRWGNLQMSRMALDLMASEGDKSLRMECDAMSATLKGHFDYQALPLMAMQTAHNILPQDIFPIDALYPHEAEMVAQSNLNFHVHWLDDGSVLEVVAPGLTVAQGSRLDGSFNASEGLKLVLRSDSLGTGDLLLGSVGMTGRQEGEIYRLALESQEVALGVVPLMQDAHLYLTSSNRFATAALDWNSDNHSTQGDLMLMLEDGHISVLKPDFTVGRVPWRLEADDLTLSNQDGLKLHGDGIGLHCDEQSLSASISLSGLPSDNMELRFHQFELQGLSDILLQDSPLAVKGRLDGRFTLFGLSEKPYFNANLTVDSCMLNQQSLGEIQLLSTWNAELNTINVTLNGDRLTADGWVELGREYPGLNFSVDFDRFDLAVLEPLLSDFSSRFEGLLHGSFDITGNTASPLIVGEALVENGALQVDLTGVTYFFNDSIQFTNNLITLRNFAIMDPLGNTATVDGAIGYNQLNDMRLDLQLQTDRLLVLDRSSGDEFYGTLLASANANVSGPIEALEVSVSARTAPGCTLTVPVDNQRQVKTQNYISFVSDETYDKPQQASANNEQNLRLELDLNITPDVQLNLPMDFSEVKVTVGATGTGDLHLSMAGSQEPQVIGSYEINSGTMKVGLISLIEKNFSLENGSSLNFQGSLPDARFDLSAVYSQRVNLSTLTGGVNGMDGTQKYLQVEDVINIAGTLREPTLGFDIRLPGADASVEEEVFAYIDRNSERDMLNQTMALLVSGHFYNANASTVNGGIATSSGIGALSSILTDMVSVVDIDVDYKAGNELTKDQVDVNISKDWGRWYLESTLGYGGESRELQSSDANTAVIDALLGYRINPLVHLFAYNRTNTNDYTRMDLPYKQGVGLKLTKDFDRWSDLFRKKQK